MKPAFIAVSIEFLEQAVLMPPYGMLRRARIVGRSTPPGADFDIETNPLSAEQRSKFERWERHGSIVVDLPEDWEYAYYNRRDGWQGAVIEAALQRVDAIVEPQEAQGEMQGFDERLAHDILIALNKVFPRAMHDAELKRSLPNQPSDEALFTALEALELEGKISGNGKRDSQSSHRRFVVMANIKISREGRESLSGRTSQPAGANVFHGDQINNYGQAGAIGRGANGTIENYDGWDATADGLDWQVLTQQLEQLRTALQKTASSREEVRQLSVIADAEEHAESERGSELLRTLSKVGANVLLCAREIGTDMAAKVISKAMGLES